MLFLELDTRETLPAFPASNHVFSGSKTRVFTVAHRAHGLGLEMHMGTNMQPCEARRAPGLWRRMARCRADRRGS